MMAIVETNEKAIPEDKARLKQRNAKRSFVVQIHHVSTPDAEGRLSRAVDLLLAMVSTSRALQEGCHRNTNGPRQQAADNDATTRADGF